ncbi:MAG: ATP-dependent 6-phosphofructokinase, partial [Acidobacteriota bacterium]
PRPDLFFRPDELACGIVTCGGLCPGLNDVIRSIFLTLHHAYGVRRIFGFRYGYAGVAADRPAPPLELDPHTVETIHQRGGTLLGTSRGPRDVGGMVDELVRWNIGILFTVGGDGTLSGASAIAEEIERRRLPISVIGIPKTIDNDLVWTERTFGFATAVEHAQSTIAAVHSEARAAWNGVGLVKLMGRHSGFIAARATLASGDVNFCLVPEVPFQLQGEAGLFAHLERRLAERRHAVVVVAEGAGQDLVGGDDAGRDLSGNRKLKDIGPFLRAEIRRHFAARQKPVNVKYIDPSYIIRSQPANAFDSSFCLMLGQHAVHAGMAGRTAMMVGFWNHRFTHVPLTLVAGRRKHLEPLGETWQRVLETTGQPALNSEAQVS